MDFYRSTEKKMDTLYAEGIDFIGLFNSVMDAMYLFWTELLNEDGIAWLDWYILENKCGTKDWKGDKDNKYAAVDDKGQPICYDDKSTYDFLISNLYLK